jgi:uncharacterized protein YdhG (YjbR/CyaY superfamily)
MTRVRFATVDAYIASFPKDVQTVLRKIRTTIRRALPGATERISYNIPTYRLERDVIYFGAFKRHVGVYPPVRDPALAARLSKYRNEKGNLQFPLDQPIPYALIGDIAKGLAKPRAKAARARRARKQQA